MGLASVIGPSLFGLSFAWAVRHASAHALGLPMFIAAAIMLACLALAWAPAGSAKAEA